MEQCFSQLTLSAMFARATEVSRCSKDTDLTSAVSCGAVLRDSGVAIV